MSAAPGPPVDDDAVTPGRSPLPSDPYIGLEIEGRYRIEHKLGAGGMGRVYRGRHLRTGAALAIKIVESHPTRSAEMQTRCFNEARAMMEVRSSHVAHAIDVGELPSGELYLVMEYLRGEDLEALLRREGPLPWSRLGPIALQLCSGLGSAHRHGIIHRDIKPSNCVRITIDDNPDHIKIIDFGIARDMDAQSGPTQKGTVIGTPEYLAPELVTGEARAGIRTDIYALGATLYKLLTGVSPFRGSNAFEVMGKHVLGERVPPSRAAPHLEIPPAADAIILRMLAARPEERFASTEELGEALREALGIRGAGPSGSHRATPATAVTPQAKAPTPAPPPQAPVLGLDSTAETLAPRTVAARALTLLATIAAFVVATRLAMPDEAPAAAERLAEEDVLADRVDASGPQGHVVSDMSEGESTKSAAPADPSAPTRVEPAGAEAAPAVEPEPVSAPPTTPEPPPAVEPEPAAAEPEQEPAPPEPAPASADKPSTPARPKPEPNFPYSAARAEIAQQLKYLRTTCMMQGDLITTHVKFRVDVAPSGAPTVRVYSGDRELRACIRKALSFPFGRSPRGGAFVYTLTQTSAEFVPVPLEPGKAK